MRKVLLAACAVLAMTGVARGEEAKFFARTAGNWEIYTLRDQCTTADTFQNGTILSFGINTRGVSWIRVMHPEWKIPAGNYSVDGQVDNGVAFSWAFEADDGGQGIVANFKMDNAAFDTFTRGKVLRLKIGSTVYGYSLNGTSALFPKLFECVGQIAKVSNPFHGQSSAPAEPAAPVATPSNPFRRT
jgi:hypothetical protein